MHGRILRVAEHPVTLFLIIAFWIDDFEHIDPLNVHGSRGVLSAKVPRAFRVAAAPVNLTQRNASGDSRHCQVVC